MIVNLYSLNLSFHIFPVIKKSKIMSSEKVLAVMTAAGKPLKGGEIAELGGIDKKEVDKAIKNLKAEGKITSPKVCYYEVKK